MIFPEHMEFRYYITPERKECYELYSMTLGCRRTLLEKTQAWASAWLTSMIPTFMTHTVYCLKSINYCVP